MPVNGSPAKKVKIVVRLKEGVLDPQGKTVKRALGSLGFHEIQGVRIGKFIELDLNESVTGAALEEHIQSMCEKLLVNPVIEDYEILGAP